MRKLLVLLIVILLSGCNGGDKDVIDTELNNGYDIITVGEIHEDTGCIFIVNDEEFNMLESSNNVDSDVLGEYLITYSYSYGGSPYSCVRYVKVIDDIDPIVTLNPGIDTITVGEEFVDAGITYSDNYDLELDVVIQGVVNTSVVGSYTITYSVEDDSLNIVEIVRIVNVIN